MTRRFSRIRISRFAALVLVATSAMLLFSWSGLYDVAASKGHWPAVAWLLRYTMENSVETRSALVEAPPLDDAALVERGAGHYETGCLPCHGAPGSPSNRIPNHMLPQPPYLPTHVEQWSTEELFRLVKHGLKYTGMPAWPALSRDDEVWAVVAFLLRLPDLSPADYARLANGADSMVAQTSDLPPLPETPGALFPLAEAVLIGACARCHGVDGGGRPSGAFPRLDLQTTEYLVRALTEYAEGVRPSGIMQPVAAALSDDQIRRLAAHYANGTVSIAVEAGQAEAEQELLARGLEIAAIGAPDRQIPACSACHGLEQGPANRLFPSISGQYAQQIRLQLSLWKAGKRGGSAYSDIMAAIVANMTEDDMDAVALYYASLPAAEPETGERVTRSGDGSGGG
jgi:cytochrome c553